MTKGLYIQLSLAFTIITVILGLYGLYLIQIELATKWDVLKTISPTLILAFYCNGKSK